MAFASEASLQGNMAQRRDAKGRTRICDRADAYSRASRAALAPPKPRHRHEPCVIPLRRTPIEATLMDRAAR